MNPENNKTCENLSKKSEPEPKAGTSACGSISRRNVLRLVGGGAGALALGSRMPAFAGPFVAADFEKWIPADKKLSPAWVKSLFERGKPTIYQGESLKYIGMPVGGVCCGQLYLGGDGKLWHWDIFNKHIRTFDEHYAKPLPVSSPVAQGFAVSVSSGGKTETRALDKTGCPEVTFRGEYPIGMVNYGKIPGLPVSVTLEAFSPFVPLSVDDSSLPATVMRFTVKNESSAKVDATLSGWLENAVCTNNRLLPGKRVNRIVSDKGYTLLSCSAEKESVPAQSPKPDILFEDWSKETYDGWTTEGTAFGTGPILKSAIPALQGDVGGDTARVVNSYAVTGTDAATGKLISRKFAIERACINLWIGGGNHKDKTCVKVVVDGKVVATMTGAANNQMALHSLNVKSFIGKQAHIEVVDAEQGSWGNIGVGRITFSDVPVGATAVLAEAEDYGTMGLALLGKAAELATASDGEKGPAAEAAQEAATSLDKKLVGALGRKLELKAGESAVLSFVVAWNFPNLKIPGKGRHYATRFPTTQSVVDHVAKNAKTLFAQTQLWRDTWYDSSLPYWFLDRTFANASILATQTSLRFANGNFWGWEGVGCCDGTCTHVWHYEHTMGRIFPELDILLRERTDFNPAAAFHADGSMGFRGGGGFAVDGQAGIILRCLRDHQVSPDDAFLKRNWSNIKKALGWLIDQDGTGDGILKKNQHNTLDAEWHGEVAWLSGLYLAALRAGEEMALEMDDTAFAKTCRKIFEAGQKNIVKRLFNGEYFIQVGDPKLPNTVGSYDGCEIDQVFGQSWAYQVGLGEVLPRKQTRIALKSLWKYNFTPDVGPFRAAHGAGRWYAMAGEAGTLMCSWPKGDGKRVTTGYDFYFNECMNGFEYQLAGHMIWEGMLEEGLAITRAVHDRYDAARRNPWNEVECGDHYARSMASYGVFIAACGFEYHGPKGYIGFAPRLTPDDFKAPFTAAEGWGTYEQKFETKNFKSTITLKHGKLRVRTISLGLAKDRKPGSVKVALNGKAAPATLKVENGKALITLAADAIIQTGEALSVVLK